MKGKVASKDRLIGGLIMVASVVGVGVYAWLLRAYALLVLQITAFIAVAAILCILAWIGYTMATTPPPTPVEPSSAGSAGGRAPAEEPSDKPSLQ